MVHLFGSLFPQGLALLAQAPEDALHQALGRILGPSWAWWWDSGSCSGCSASPAISAAGPRGPGEQVGPRTQHALDNPSREP